MAFESLGEGSGLCRVIAASVIIRFSTRAKAVEFPWRTSRDRERTFSDSCCQEFYSLCPMSYHLWARSCAIGGGADCHEQENIIYTFYTPSHFYKETIRNLYFSFLYKACIFLKDFGTKRNFSQFFSENVTRNRIEFR